MDRDEWRSPVSGLDGGTILVRGYPIAELIDRLPFSAAVYLVLRGELPGVAEATVFNACLCAILDYAMGPAPYAARVVASANPHVVPAIAAGVLAQGANAVSPQDAGEFIAGALGFMGRGRSLDEVAEAVVDAVIQEGRRIPGLGRPGPEQVDERAGALEQVLRDTGQWNEACELYSLIHRRWVARTGKPLVINVDGMLAAGLTTLGFRPVEMAGVAALSFLPGIIANVVEELTSGARIRQIAGLRYTGARRRHLPNDVG